MKYIAWFKELNKDSISIAGGKGANLAEMVGARFPVPPGFVVTAQTYESFITRTGLRNAILDKLKNLDVEDTQKLQITAQHIQQLIMKTAMLDDIKEAIIDSYDVLGAGGKTTADILMQGTGEFVAVRSSATAEDLPEASFAGQQSTYLNVRGASSVVKAVHACWASLFTSRAIYYRTKNNFPHDKVLIAVVVQKMVNSDAAGVMFTINPSTNNEHEVVIEAALGLGEAVVSGQVTPDLYVLDKDTLAVKKAEAKEQGFKLIRDSATGRTVKEKIFLADDKMRVLTDRQLGELARLGKKLEQHYHHAQDVEWAIEKEYVYIVQTRAVTTLKAKVDVRRDERAVSIEQREPESLQPRSSEKLSESHDVRDDGLVILRGQTASAGHASGPVRIIMSARELSKIAAGDILVTGMTNPDMVPAMQKAAAIVTDAGGMTSHAAIVSREIGIPCIVGTERATKLLRDGMRVTVDAAAGVVYQGTIAAKRTDASAAAHVGDAAHDPSTITRVKVVMDFPQHAERIARTHADGIGLLRLEFIIAGGGVHPAQYIRENKDPEYVELLVREIGKAARAFAGKPVWARTSDLRSDEYRNLKGGNKEPEETDPMIGWHGIRRGLDEPRILKAEFLAVKKLHEQGLKNVGIMLPFVIHADEVRQAKQLCREVGLEPRKDVAFGVMLETPAACLVIEELCKEGIDFVSFGTNDLTQLTLGIDRNNQRIQKQFDELHPAVLSLIGHSIDVCRRHKVETSICGQAGSKPAMAEFLVRHGIDSISANPDAVHTIRRVVADVEKKIKR